METKRKGSIIATLGTDHDELMKVRRPSDQCPIDGPFLRRELLVAPIAWRVSTVWGAPPRDRTRTTETASCAKGHSCGCVRKVTASWPSRRSSTPTQAERFAVGSVGLDLCKVAVYDQLVEDFSLALLG